MLNGHAKAATTVVFVLLVAVAGVVGNVAAQKSTNLQNTPQIEEALRQAAKAVNETAPLQIDKNTKLMNAVALDKRLRYRYSLSHISARDFEKGSLIKLNAERMRNNVCSSEGMKILVKLGAVLEYAYYDRDGIELEIVSIETAKCN